MMRISAGIARIALPLGAGIASIFRRRFFVALLAVITVYYLFLLSNGTFRIFAPEMLDKVFNSMLVNLFHGDFTIDRKAINFEGANFIGTARPILISVYSPHYCESPYSFH